MDGPRRILLVDDEPQITRVLRASLSSRGYEIRVANDGDSAFDLFKSWTPDLVITDLSMPSMTGIELCRRIRTKSQAPIIVLSVKGEEQAKVQALDAGADDYVMKPFNINELLARIRANLRRVVPADEEPGPLEVGDFNIDFQGHLVKVRGQEIRLTPKEFDLLAYLAKHPWKVITHTVLLQAVWGSQSVQQPEYLRVFIGQLRKKIESESSRHYILTEPWIGYRFEPAPAAE